MPGGCYHFGDVVVDEAAHALWRGGELQPIEPKAFAVLLALLERPGELIPRDELLDRVWGHRHVTPGVLTRAIAQLRAGLGDDVHDPRYIQTRHSLGYAFIAELVAAPESPESPTACAHDLAAMPVGGDRRALPGRRHPEVPAVDGQRPRRPARVWGAMVVAAAVLAAVLAWTGGRGPRALPAEASIAVLPFASVGSDRDLDFFAEGLAAEMHDALAGVGGLKVAARIPPSAASGLDPDVRELGRALGVATVLDASVRREGDRVRINARLSDCTTGFTLWSNSYDRKLDDVFQTQIEIAGDVVRSLLGSIPNQRDMLAGRLAPTRSTAAYDAYLRGTQQLRLAGAGGGGIDSAIEWFGRALEEDSGFARAQAGICRSRLVRFNADRDAQAFEDARIACALAKDMAPDLAEVDLALGDLHRASGDHGEAMAYYARALRDRARAPAALVGMAQVHADRGEYDRAAGYFQQALELRPGDAMIHGFLGLEHYRAGHPEQAIKAFRRSVELKPDSAWGWSSLGGVYLAAGRNREAQSAFERALAIQPTAGVLSNYAEIKKQQHDYRAAATLLRRALELESGSPLIWGNLGDALQADPATAGEAREAYAQAARLVGEYLEINPDDASMTAASGWYLLNIGERGQALQMVRRSGQLGAGQAEVGMFNAQTMAMAGDREAARRWIEVARESGVPESRIRAQPRLVEVLEGTAGEEEAEEQT